jgi:hypothetical protein
MQPTIYRGVEIRPNFNSIHGTGAPLKTPRGVVLHLPGYGSLGWEPSMRQARASIDSLHIECAPGVRRALDIANP